MSLPMVLGMTNYEIVDRTGLAHCAPMVGDVTPFEWSDMRHHSRSLVGNITLVAFHVANIWSSTIERQDKKGLECLLWGREGAFIR